MDLKTILNTENRATRLSGASSLLTRSLPSLSMPGKEITSPSSEVSSPLTTPDAIRMEPSLSTSSTICASLGFLKDEPQVRDTRMDNYRLDTQQPATTRSQTPRYLSHRLPEPLYNPATLNHIQRSINDLVDPSTSSSSFNSNDLDNKNHDFKDYACSTCGKSFARRSDLGRHEKIHTNDRPNVCNICDKRFIQRSALTVHRRVHTGEKPHACGACDKSFSDSSSLARHRRIHTGDRPYVCKYPRCGRTFTRRSTLNKHLGLHPGWVQKTNAVPKRTRPSSNSNSRHNSIGSDGGIRGESLDNSSLHQQAPQQAQARYTLQPLMSQTNDDNVKKKNSEINPMKQLNSTGSGSGMQVNLGEQCGTGNRCRTVENIAPPPQHAKPTSRFPYPSSACSSESYYSLSSTVPMRASVPMEESYTAGYAHSTANTPEGTYISPPSGPRTMFNSIIRNCSVTPNPLSFQPRTIPEVPMVFGGASSSSSSNNSNGFLGNPAAQPLKPYVDARNIETLAALALGERGS